MVGDIVDVPFLDCLRKLNNPLVVLRLQEVSFIVVE